jgi:hypothetical protein
MCTSEAPDTVVVCDVALADVRRVVGALPGVTLTHVPFEGTRVHSRGDVAVEAFRAAVGEAIAPHGGSLPTC